MTQNRDAGKGGRCMHKTICTICHQKNDNSLLSQINHIKSYLRSHEKDDKEEKNEKDAFYITNLIYAFEMSMHTEHCPYGMPCHILGQKKVQIYAIAVEISPKMITFLRNATPMEFEKLLRLLQGYFPVVYRECRNIWFETHRE